MLVLWLRFFLKVESRKLFRTRQGKELPFFCSSRRFRFWGILSLRQVLRSSVIVFFSERSVLLLVVVLHEKKQTDDNYHPIRLAEVSTWSPVSAVSCKKEQEKLPKQLLYESAKSQNPELFHKQQVVLCCQKGNLVPRASFTGAFTPSLQCLHVFVIVSKLTDSDLDLLRFETFKSSFQRSTHSQKESN